MVVFVGIAVCFLYCLNKSGMLCGSNVSTLKTEAILPSKYLLFTLSILFSYGPVDFVQKERSLKSKKLICSPL